MVVNVPFSIPSHEAAGAPEDERRVLAHVEQLLPAPQHPLQTGVSYDTQACSLTDVLLIADAGGVVHADDTVRAVNFSASLAPS